MPLTHELCVEAVMDTFKDKWMRKDFIIVAEKYSGVSRKELLNSITEQDWNVRVEIAEGIAYEIEQRIEDLMNEEATDLDLDPVRTFKRIDGISMKIRDLTSCCPLHQVYSHLMVLGLMPLFKSKNLPCQYASIPGKGQIELKRQVERWLRKESLGINYAKKLDIKSAYQSTKKEIILKILNKEIPKAKWIIVTMDSLLDMSPNGGLLIGGYMESWLFNLAASYIIRQIKSYCRYRRNTKHSFITRCLTYMDDFCLFARRRAGLENAVKKITKWVKDEFNYIFKESSNIIEFLSFKEERIKRHFKGAAKGCPGIDVAGFVIHRSYTTIRKKIFLKLRRQFLRAVNDIAVRGNVQLWRARKIISYNGYLRHTKARGVSSLLQRGYIVKASASIISYVTSKTTGGVVEC